MFPNQGRIGPYQKIPVFFRFSPRWANPRQAFEVTLPAAPRQDFALFMHVQMVGSNQQQSKVRIQKNVQSMNKIIAFDDCLPKKTTGILIAYLLHYVLNQSYM